MALSPAGRPAGRPGGPPPDDPGDVSLAAYAAGSGTHVLEFEYLVLADQDTGGLPVRLPNGSSTSPMMMESGFRIMYCTIITLYGVRYTVQTIV